MTVLHTVDTQAEQVIFSAIDAVHPVDRHKHVWKCLKKAGPTCAFCRRGSFSYRPQSLRHSHFQIRAEAFWPAWAPGSQPKAPALCSADFQAFVDSFRESLDHEVRFPNEL